MSHQLGDQIWCILGFENRVKMVNFLFTALRESCQSVHLSVSPSDKRAHCDKTEEKSVQIFIPYGRSFSLVFCEKEWLMGSITSI